ncbi:MAG: c-type cytochrome [Anaerolineae bacterium]
MIFLIPNHSPELPTPVPTLNSAERLQIGEAIYKSSCATCHGEDGRSEVCYMPETVEQIACSGRPLNHPALLCGDESDRMQVMVWYGSKRGFIESTIAAGRTMNGMPAYSDEYSDGNVGLNALEIDAVTDYVMGYETDELCKEIGSTPDSHPLIVSNLPEGDAQNGEELYHITYGCSACHGSLEQEGSNAVGSWTGIFHTLGENRLEVYTAADYVYESILLPSKHISPDCPMGPCTGPPSGMPDNFGRRMSNQDIADVMAYLGIDTADSNGVEIIYPPN